MHESQTDPRGCLRPQISSGVGAQISSDGFGRASRESLEGDFQEIAERCGFEIDTQEVFEDHVNISLSARPRYSPAQVAQRMKSISSRMVFQEFPEVKQQL